MSEDERDELLEEVAGQIERVDFRELAGIAAPRKADRLQAQHRNEGWAQARAVFAADVRAMKGRRDGDALVMLTEIETMNHRLIAGRDYGRFWPLIREGLIDVAASIPLTGNTIPAKAALCLTLSNKGQRYLAAHNAHPDGGKSGTPSPVSQDVA
jgi:hypothetical protein